MADPYLQVEGDPPIFTEWNHNNKQDARVEINMLREPANILCSDNSLSRSTIDINSLKKLRINKEQVMNLGFHC